MLSHGQATVERGFSINKQIETENLKETSYISQRLVNDYLKNFEHIQDVMITEDIRRSVASSRMKYEEYLREQKQKQQSSSAGNKRKLIEDDLVFIKKKIYGFLKKKYLS